ncbi:growth-regulating factor 10-like isoform X1 [Nymphaea colorata]|nr:growth-regulating factor 10-like isoform X1 [Nymphaea colorata]
MEALQMHIHHQQWRQPHTEVEDHAETFLQQQQQPPVKLSRLASPRDASRLSGMAAPVGLGLGLGPGTGQSAFTFLQLQELEHQALIFKYMVAGVPVPLHLVLPIWKSVVSSPMSSFSPSTLSGGGLCFDFRSSMEPEPGRCRRTDGKKWRCSKEVVPDHKYCEKHMHRGKNRSRKPVERQTPPGPSKSTAATTTSATATASIANTISDSSTHLSISMPDGLNLMNNHSNANANNVSASVSSSPRLEFSPTSVLHKMYYGCSVSESSSGSTSKTESNFS